MSQRRSGPVRGAGVGIIELEGEKPIEAGALGWVAYAGVLEKGPTNKLITASSSSKFAKKCGSYIDDSLLPDACKHYFKIANGAGGILLVRVTDGNELQSEITLYSRSSTRKAMGKIKAANGGRWGGKEKKFTDDLAAAGDLLETTLDTKTTMLKDEWKGGYVELEEVPNKQYPILSNTAAGVVTVASDQTMKTDWGAGPSLRYYLVRENAGKALSVEVRDGEENPSTEFGLFVYVDGALANQWPNLSADSTSTRYWVNLINNDENNDEIWVQDLWTGEVTTASRPANFYGISSAVEAEALTAVIHEFNPAATGDGNGTCALGSTTDVMLEQKITITFSNATTAEAVSDKFGSLGTVTVGSLFEPNCKWAPSFTLTAGATPWANLDVATLTYKPFVADALIGGYLYPDKVNYPREKYRIVDNTHKVITVASGSDLTSAGAPADQFMVVAAIELTGGRDGIADLEDANYEQAFDVDDSLFNQILGKNLGLVKFACPGVTATAVQKAGAAYADAKNHQFRYEIPSNLLTEEEADAYINSTLGRNDFCVVSFPSYGYVADPSVPSEGKLKLVSLTGAIHGREARIACDYEGYHKAEAGLDATLPMVLKITTEDAILDEEYLNPLGIGVIKKMKGNFVIWGDRSLCLNTTWKWKHQREQMCHYENSLREGFDWIVYAINDPIEEKRLIASLRSFFMPEWQKRALRGKTFEEAAIIKVDGENNTDATRAAGDMYADVSLCLADTVERLLIRVGKQGIFESAV